MEHTLDSLLEKLNQRVQTWNAELDEDVELGDATSAQADKLRIPQTMIATAEMVYKEPRHWPLKLAQVVTQCVSEVVPSEIVDLVKEVQNPTEVTRLMGFGAKKAVLVVEKSLASVEAGYTDEELLVPNMGWVRSIDLAHLLARLEMAPSVPVTTSVLTN